MKLTIQELETCIRQIIYMLQKAGVKAIDVKDRDLYWQILTDDWLDFDEEAKAAVGSLADDIAALKRVAAGEEIPTRLDLDRLASALKLLDQDFP